MPRKSRRDFWLQYGAAAVASATAMGYGCVMSWSSPAIIHLEENKAEFGMTADNLSWVTRILPISLFIGDIINPFIMNQFRRKTTLLILAIPQIVSWLLIMLTKNFIVIYIARIVGGIGYGAGLCALTVYLSELGNKKNRGIFLALIKFSSSLGIALTLFLGAFVSYESMNLGLLLVSTIFAVIFIFMPDSSYFIQQQNVERTIDLELEFPQSGDVESEKLKLDEEENLATRRKSHLERITPIRENVSISESESFSKFKDSSFGKLITLQSNLLALVIMIFINAQGGLSGHMALRYFTQSVFTYEDSFLPPAKASVGIACIKLLASVIGTQVMERFKRKTLILSSGLSAAFAQAFIGIYFYLSECGINVSRFNFIPFVGLLIFEFVLTIGISNIFYVYMGEIFSTDVKGLGVTIGNTLHMIFIFISIVMYQFFQRHASNATMFFTYTILGAITTIVTFLITPETKGKTIDEIQEKMKTRKVYKNVCGT